MIQNEAEIFAFLNALREFERTYNLTTKFNLFDALNLARSEIRHSRFLSYLLDPSKPHGLSGRLLHEILLSIAVSNNRFPISKLQLALTDYADAKIYCERDHFDISVEIPSLKLLFVIENKIDAIEGDGQLKKYRNTAINRYPDFNFFGCFLTREGYDGGDLEWAPLSYSGVVQALRRILSWNEVSDEVKIAVDHYINLVEKKIMPSDELIEICKRIFRQHRTAIDLIYEHGNESVLELAYQEFRKNHPNLGEPLTSRKDTLYFVPGEWLEKKDFQVAEKGVWPTNCPILFWFKMGTDKIYLTLEVGPVAVTSALSRGELVSKLKEKLEGTSRKNEGETYTRIKSKNVKFLETDGAEQIENCLKDLWKNIGGDAVVETVAMLAGEMTESKKVRDSQ